MALRNKIDSNSTGLAYAEESALGVLSSPRWVPLEPNEYDEFGGELSLVARNPINSGRQRKKGAITDLEAAGGFNQDFTLENTPDLLQGFVFASYRRKLELPVTEVLVTGYEVADASAVLSGALFMASGFGTAANNGFKLATGTGATEVQVSGLVAEATPPDTAKIVLVGREHSAGVLSVDATPGQLPRLNTSGDWSVLGLTPGEWIFIGGDDADERFDTAANNGFKRIREVTEDYLILDQSLEAMADDTGTGKTIRVFFARFLKNEADDSLIVRRSYHLERQLSKPDTTDAYNQAEYIKGAVPSEMTINIESADKMTIDLSFMATDFFTTASDVGPLAGTRVTIDEADAFNTSSDIKHIRLAVQDANSESPTPLFGYVTDLTVSINNNVSANKAVGVLGAFDVTVGSFEVGAEVTAYFTDVAAVETIRSNADVGLFVCTVKENAGFVLDVPLVAVGSGRLEIETDEAIMLPLEMNAGTAAKIDRLLDHTLSFSFFDYLPDLADD